jgi:hypothetical protein
VTFDYNMYDIARWEWKGSPCNSLSSWKSVSGQDTHSFAGDPLFVDPANGHFRLTSGSPAVDTGMDVGLPYLGIAPDLGAFEYETTTIEKPELREGGYSGLSSYANPASGRVTFFYDSRRKGRGSFALYAMNGKLLRTLDFHTGASLVWNTHNHAPGMYVARLTKDSRIHTHEVTVSAK